MKTLCCTPVSPIIPHLPSPHILTCDENTPSSPSRSPSSTIPIWGSLPKSPTCAHAPSTHPALGGTHSCWGHTGMAPLVYSCRDNDRGTQWWHHQGPCVIPPTLSPTCWRLELCGDGEVPCPGRRATDGSAWMRGGHCPCPHHCLHPCPLAAVGRGYSRGHEGTRGVQGQSCCQGMWDPVSKYGAFREDSDRAGRGQGPPAQD